MFTNYDFETIEKKWQAVWDEREAFRARDDSPLPKYYCLEMYPYPSGRIHMGHVRNYSIGDVVTRFQRARGFEVLHPIGWDALGLPAENAAIKHGVPPRTWTLDNVAHMKSQLRRMGFAYDWGREVNTCLPDYYRWNQWIFLKMLERGLAFRKESWVNWCSQCQTVLANEQVVGGGCWRCETPVVQKKMEQWFLKITDYADELLTGHAALSKWPEHVLQMQRNWIGKSWGAHVRFPVPALGSDIEVFTTRLDTICGATFLVLSAEHPLAASLVKGPREKELRDWIDRTIVDSKLKRGLVDVEKEGVDTGATAVNPFTGEKVPIWLANYVLMEYGTGAIMAVPAHDQRDLEFARKYGLPVRTVIVPPSGAPAPQAPPDEAFEDPGILVNSGPYDGLTTEQAVQTMGERAESEGFGRRSVIFRLRDWGISRQRYWGTPIPIIYCKKCGMQPVPYEDLPVEIPLDVEITGEEGSPLERSAAFVNTTCPKCGGPARRETDTMDTFVDSSWYFFRYCSPRDEARPFEPEQAARWMPVDLYIGGVEHAILHLIYSRFFTKVLRDFGLTGVSEPFPHYLAQGMVTKDGSAMSKSKGNIVDPDQILKTHGADALRLFILFAAPPEKEFAWAEEGLEGCSRFLNRVWTMVQESLDLFAPGESAPNPAAAAGEPAATVRKRTHQAIRKVTEDIETRFHLNTAISTVMELYNLLRKEKDALRRDPAGRAALREAIEATILLLGPFAPHVAEEMWERTGHRRLVLRTPWPSFDPELAREETVTIVVQVDGKLRDRFEAAAGSPDDEVRARALALPRVQAALAGRTPRKVIVLRDKLVSIVG